MKPGQRNANRKLSELLGHIRADDWRNAKVAARDLLSHVESGRIPPQISKWNKLLFLKGYCRHIIEISEDSNVNKERGN